MRSLLCALFLAAISVSHARDLLVVTSADGEATYQPIFKKEAETWSDAAGKAGMKVQDLQSVKREDLQKALEALPKDGDDLWLVLIGHGTFDGKTAKFNLRGDDVSSTDLASWLAPFHRRVLVWNLFSASGAFLPDLSSPNRVIVTATRSGSQRNYARFGEKLAEALDNTESDLDGDGAASVVELVASATALTKASYENDQRIVVENALLDDNGDGAGTEAARLTAPAENSGRKPDGSIAAEISLARDNNPPALTPAQIRQRDAIESRIAELKNRKPELNEVTYYSQLEKLLLELARLYQGNSDAVER
jgi:hypothetical protein